MLQYIYLISNIEKSGGLFDFDGTLFIIAVQFLILMVILNIILYTPLLNVIDERNQHINKNLAQASITLAQASKLSKQYELELLKARKEAQSEIFASQKLHKDILDTEIHYSQKLLDNYLTDITKTLKNEKSKILVSLEKEIDSLSNEIMTRITL
jgi:F-type H+-transporting ATPase subunit b